MIFEFYLAHRNISEEHHHWPVHIVSDLYISVSYGITDSLSIVMESAGLKSEDPAKTTMLAVYL